MNRALVDIQTVEVGDYHPLVYFESWRVAILRDAPRFRYENMDTLQRHNTSDEVFVLLEGSCTLYIGDGGSEGPGTIEPLVMEPCHIYNVRKGVWHNCATTEGTALLIVENADVSQENTDTITVQLL